MSRRALLAFASATTMAAAFVLQLSAASAAEAERPSDPTAAAAFDMLKKHCSRCHQDGSLVDRLKPVKNFGNILHLDEIAKMPQYIQPGNPDGSLIFNQLAKQEMPYDLYYEQKSGVPEPTADELKALRTWIESLKTQTASACATRKFVSNGDIVASISDDLKKTQNARVKGMRYFTLTNLYNACVSDEELEVYRQGAVKLLNSLSRSSDVVRLETVDPEKTIIRFNLTDVGWDEADWNLLLTNFPYRVRPDDKLFEFTTQATGTILPYIRADWFAFSASQPALYDKLLKLPADFKGLQDQQGVNVDDNIKKQTALRSGFQISGVSQHNRLIERHQTRTGYFWTSYDFGGDREKQSLFAHPTGPGGDKGFTHDGGETIFSLPNGFQAYYLSTADGKSLDKGPTKIVRDLSRKDLTVTNGISCMGCHDQGIRKAKDEIRGHVLGDRASFSKDIRDAVEALYPPTEKMDAVLEDDAKRFRAAMERAGLNPTLKWNGVEMVNALAAKYEANVDANLAAAEFGLKPEALKQAVVGSARANALMRRLAQGLAPRDQFEAEFPKIIADLTDDKIMDAPKVDQPAGAAPVEVAKAKSEGEGTTSAFDIALTSDKLGYKQNERAVFTVIVKKDCKLTLTNVDSKGTGTILFPNQFQQNNDIVANKPFNFGDASTPFTFRLADKGEETVIAECALPQAATRGLKATGKDGGFTNVGNFSDALSRKIVVDGQQAKQAAAPQPDDVKAAAAKKEQGVVRTAIKINVE
jgi:hypothetical protein